MRKNLLEKGEKVSYFQPSESGFLYNVWSKFVYGQNWEFLSITEWQLFINSSKWSLKWLLLYNLYSTVSIGHSVCLYEVYGDTMGVIQITIRAFVLTLKWYASFLVSNRNTPSIPTFCARRTREIKRSIGWRGIDLQDLTTIQHSPWATC